MVASRENFPLLAELLAEQRRLDTPVAQFSAAHDQRAFGTPAFAPMLIPLSLPQAGEQYAFEVDLDSCTGCKSCVAACHSLNGLDDTETWRDVGLLVSPSKARPLTQTITTACHHCADPACLNGCPVLAYEKDPVTGIVRHLDDQCIGCSYCILKCPYDVPKFSERLGIVRKCDMCHSRLAEGEAPACAQACPTHAIKIITVSVTPDRIPPIRRPQTSPAARASITPAAAISWVRPSAAGAKAAVAGFLPGAPDPAYTQPTTRYLTSRPLPENLIAGDAATLRVQPAHGPLVVMLTLIPTAVGLAVAATLLPVDTAPEAANHLTVCSWLAGAIGLSASGFHLGKPLRAWRIFLGWRKSWLSREAMTLGAWFPLATATLLAPGLAPASAFVGMIGLYCSAMIYIDTRRHFWRASQTLPRFLGTAALAALAILAPKAAAIALLAKIAWESRSRYDDSMSARLQRGPLAALAVARESLGLLALLLLIVWPGWTALAVLVAGEWVERTLFFRAVDAPKMPGVPA